MQGGQPGYLKLPACLDCRNGVIDRDELRILLDTVGEGAEAVALVSAGKGSAPCAAPLLWSCASFCVLCADLAPGCAWNGSIAQLGAVG